MKKIKENTYLNICDWMMKLDLSSKELLLYALMYSYSMDGNNSYYGSASYLAEWISASSRKTVFRCLQSLEDKGLIRKETLKLPHKQVMNLYQVTEPKGDYKLYDCITIYPFMINDLGLKDRQLILYAMIYKYSSKGSDSWCSASFEYFAKWLNLSSVKSTFNHIRDRYLNPMKEENLIETRREGFIIRYRAIVPEDIDDAGASQNNMSGNGEIDKTPHFDTTLNDGNGGKTPQNDTTWSQFDTTLHPKMTPNIYTDIRVIDNNTINNNSNNNLSTIDYPSKEDLSVVVNEEIPVSDFTMDLEKSAFAYKQSHDHELYTKHAKKNPYLPEIMKACALDSFRIMLARWPDTSLTDRAESLLIDTVCSPKFKDRQKEILNLSKEKLKELFRVALSIYDPDDPLEIHKSKKAYLIGALEIMLQEFKT